MIAIIDAGLGNPRSCLRMLDYVGAPAALVNDPHGLGPQDRVILPGVGHFGSAMGHLRRSGWADAILNFVATGRPLLGICLGMQLLGTGSDEGEEPGLGLLPWRVERLPSSAGIRVPHMGWNEVERTADSALHGDEVERYYFVHGYYVPAAAQGVTAVCSYGVEIGSTVEHGNLFGVQFHPEKSHRFGMTLLKRFCAVTA